MELYYRPAETIERFITEMQLAPVDPLTKEIDRSAILIALGEIIGVFSDEYRDEQAA
jgi:hypothetical protein